MNTVHNKTVLVEIDDASHEQHIEKIEKWLGNVVKLQLSLSGLIKKAEASLEEPHIKEAIGKIAEAEKMHEQQADQLLQIFSKDSSTVKDVMIAEVMSTFEVTLMKLQDWMGGAVGSWQYLHHLLLLNQQSMGAFAVAEQLGLAIGNKELVKISFEVVHEKSMHHLLLMEYMLEMAPNSILYKDNI